MKFIKITILALLIISCAPIHVNYDYDKEANFGAYKTYQYYGSMETGLNELDTKRLLNGIIFQKILPSGLMLSPRRMAIFGRRGRPISFR